MAEGRNKITIIGAGSIVFTKKLIADILSYPSLEGSTISLMDIDPHRLDLINKLAMRMVSQSGKRFDINPTQDRREALADSSYVIVTIQVGGLEAYQKDIEIPAKYGVEQCVGDTLGPGGLFRGLRTIPVLTDIARDMEETCPDALMLEYSNPMSMNVWALSQTTRIRAVGLCHSIPNTAERLAQFIGADMHDVNYLAAGINHMAWFLMFEWRGKDAYQLIREVVRKSEVYGMDPVRSDLMNHFGYFVSESSGHASEYYPYFRKRKQLIDELVNSYTTPDAFWHEWGRTAGYLHYSQKRLDELDEHLSRQISGEERVELERSNEFSIQIIDSIEGDSPRRVYANIRNSGLITNLPHGSCVEVPCLVDKGGVSPCYVGELPPQLAALCRNAIGFQEMGKDAAIRKKRELVYHALSLDPLTAAVLSLDEIRSMADEMIQAERAWLPTFV